jgi:hypothetical protein
MNLAKRLKIGAVASSQSAFDVKHGFLVVLTISTVLCWLEIVAAQMPNNIDISGRWKGTRATSGQIGAEGSKVQGISFDLIENGQTIGGSYKCYASKKANTDCNNPVGKIVKGSINGDSVKLDVQTLPNDVMCSFTGKINESKIVGTYTCYAGGSLSSIGNWQVHRY